MRVTKAIMVLLLAAALMLAGCSGASGRQSAAQGPVNISVWTYYNGEQLAAFQQLVDEFNDGVGKEKGIVVKGSNLGSVNDLRDAVMNSADGKIGADPMPNIFAAYPDTAYAIDQRGMIADLSEYLSDEERDLYIEGYLQEGSLGASGAIEIFPVAKSVEVFLLNKTDFEPFAQATGVDYDDLSTFEGVTKAAQQYYEWTDAQTSEPNDGKALFGRDAMANYMYIGAKQLGVNLVTVADDGTVKLDFDKATARKLWDNYYIPFVKGHFDATGHYRSDDIKTGNIIALVGSSSGATYFPAQVSNDVGETRDIEMQVLPCPQFAGSKGVAVQQGAGMAVVDTSAEEVQACVEFLKWFTDKEQNIVFSVSSGYLPVTKAANDIEAIRSAEGGLSERMGQILSVSLETVAENELYTPQAFEHGTEFREVLEYAMSDAAAADAQAVRDQVASGTPYDQAIAPYVADERFDTWYQETRAQLEELAH